MDKQLHAGHRARMLSRLENNEAGLQEHELLEILLYNAIPRKNTNEIAHALLKTFGSVSGVFRASYSALCAVKGVGPSAAAYLKVISALLGRLRDRPVKEYPCTGNFLEFSKVVAENLRGLNEEYIELYATDDQGYIHGMERFGSREQNSAKLDPVDISRFFASYRPKAVVVAHNHLSGRCAPSGADDMFTRRLCAFCSLHGVRLLDHIIVGDAEIYSYSVHNRMEYVQALPLEV